MTITFRLISMLILCSFLFGANLHAQSAWLPPADRSSISVETYRLDRSSNDNGITTFITARFQKSSGLTYVLDIPFVHSDESIRNSLSGSFNQGSQTALGNPYFGISYKGNSPTSILYDVGIRVPLTPKEKSYTRNIGIQTDFDRWGAFVSDQVSLRALVGGYWSKEDNPHTGWIKGGSTLLISSNGKGPDLLVDLQSGVWYRGDNVIYGFNFNGRALLTRRNLSLTDRYEFLFGFGFMVDLGHFRPGLHARMPISQRGLFRLGANQGATFGISLSMFIGGNEDD